MAVDFTLPALRDSAEVIVARWLKQAGDTVAAHEKLLEVYSTQFDWDIPAPSDGTLEAIRVGVGERAKVGDVLAVIRERSAVNGEQATTGSHPATAIGDAPSAISQRVTPIAARIAAAHSLDLSQAQGTGLGGRITKDDVLTVMAVQRPVSSVPSPLAISQPTNQPTPEGDQWLEWSSAQRARAEHIARRRQEVPHISSFVEVDMSGVLARRDALQAAWQKREGFALGVLPFVVQAAVAALRAVPIVNSAFAPNGIALKKNLHIGVVGAQVRAPLHTMTVMHAETLNLVGIARRIARPPQDAPDATFTIDARGLDSGALFYTAVVGEGQAATLGVGAVQPHAVVLGEALAIKPMMHLSLTYDHRVVDGIVAGQFFSAIKQQLQTM